MSGDQLPYLLSLLQQGDRIVAGNRLYAARRSCFAQEFARFSG